MARGKGTGLSDEALDFFRKQGARGGKKRKQRLSKEELKAQARNAANTRWAKAKATVNK